MDNLSKNTNKNELIRGNNNIRQRCARDTIIKAANFDMLHSTIIIDEILNKLLQAEMNEARQIRREMPLLVEGRMNIRKKNNKYYFTHTLKKKEKGISKRLEVINSLARRRYLGYRSIDIEQNLHLLENLIKSYKRVSGIGRTVKTNTIKRMTDAGISPVDIFFTEEQVQWIDSMYSPNPYQASQLKYQTDGGVYVRSKLEAIFGTALEHRGIPYRYDDIIQIKGKYKGSEPYEKSYFADFKIPNLRGGISVLEIFGLMDNSDYAYNALKRLCDYNSCQNLSPEEIFFAFNHDITNQSRLNSLINRMLLPL